MTDPKNPKGENEDSGDAEFRATMSEEGFDPDAEGMKWGQAKPKILMPEARKAINTASEKGGKSTGKGR